MKTAAIILIALAPTAAMQMAESHIYPSPTATPWADKCRTLPCGLKAQYIKLCCSFRTQIGMWHFFTQGVAVGLGYIGLSARNAAADFQTKID
jgi:hypothetical protein